MKIKTKVQNDWRPLLDAVPKNAIVYATDTIRTFIEETKREYEKLHDKNDFIWLKSFDVLTRLGDPELIKFIKKIYDRGIISDLYLPLTVVKVDGTTVTVKSRSIFFSEEAALEESIKNPRNFQKNFIKFKVKDWNTLQEISQKMYDQLGIDPSKPKQVSFDKSSGKLIYEGEECQLPFKKLEYYIAEAFFSRPPETKFTEDDLSASFDREGNSPSRIYDGVGRINRRVKTYLGVEKLISYKGSYYWLNKIS